MSTALYRRYRPDSFETLIGQDHVTVPLRAALKAGKVTHAYLFSGPRGCGKTTSARIFARCLNCAQGPTDTPCGTCDSCVELATGGPGSLDVVEIDAASHGGVDDARELRERATFAPVRDRFKIFIIDEAHMVSSQGFNALLKLVEEPPEHVKFVFATTELDKVLGTIRSRTHHYPFRLVPPDVLEPYLAHLAGQEHVDIASGVLNLVIRAGGGSVRDTLSVLDQLMAGAVDGSLPYAQAVALLGYTDVALLDESVDALAGGDGAAVYRVVERMVDAGHDPRRFVEDLLQRLRDLLIISVAGEGAADVLGSVPSDQLERMVVQARNWGPRALSRAADLTDQALRAMVGATSPRLQLELLIGRILVPESAAGAGAAGPLSGVVGLPGGGAPVEASGGMAGGPGALVQGGGRFGAAQAREQLRRQRGEDPAGQVHQGADSQASVERPVVKQQAADPAVAAGSASAPAAGVTSPWPVAGNVTEPQPAVPQPVAAQWDPVPAPSASPEPAAPQPGAAAVQTAPAQTADAAPTDVAVASAKGGEQLPGQQNQTTAADADMLRQRWPEVIERLSSISRVAWAMLRENAQLGGVDASAAVVLLPVQAMVDNFLRGNRASDVERAIYEATGLRLSVSAQVGQAMGGTAVTTPSLSAQAVPPKAQPVPESVPASASMPVPVSAPVEAPAPVESPKDTVPAWPTPAAVPAPAVEPVAESESAPASGMSAPSLVPSDVPAWPDPVSVAPVAPVEPVEPVAPVVPVSAALSGAQESETPVPGIPVASQWDDISPVAVAMAPSVAPAPREEAAVTTVHEPTPVVELSAVAAADDDSASLDDEDANVVMISGLEAVQQILGAKVIEEKTEESAW